MKKQHVAIAKIIASEKERIHSYIKEYNNCSVNFKENALEFFSYGLLTIENIQNHFADVFANESPNFDRSEFTEASGMFDK